MPHEDTAGPAPVPTVPGGQAPTTGEADQSGGQEGPNYDQGLTGVLDELGVVQTPAQALVEFRRLVSSGADIYQAFWSSPLLMGLTVSGADNGVQSRPSTIREMVDAPRLWSAADIQALQRQLFEAGAYDAAVYANDETVNWGVFDAATRQAWGMALAQMAYSGRTNVDNFLAESRQSFLSSGQTMWGTSRAESTERQEQQPAQISVTSDETITEIAMEVGRELLGRHPNDAELASIIDRIQGKERANQQRFYDLSNQYSREAAEGGPSGGYNAQAGSAALSNEQALVAQEIIDVGREMGVGDDMIVMALMVGMMESGLRNLPYGHGTSVGVFQQTRTSYGPAEGRLDVKNATRMFFEEALTVERGNSLAEWAAHTQRPAGYSKSDPSVAAAKYQPFIDNAGAVYQRFDLADVNPVNQASLGGGMRLSREDATRGTNLRGGRASANDLPDYGMAGSVTAPDHVDPFVTFEIESVNPRAEATAFFREKNPVEYQAHEFANRADEFIKMLMSSQDYF